ncbi:hypothetical protein CVT25_013234 [Psilocybe cyanescens]|uniref:Uncharacterized protein n=1 Tax=Psilocybe cyanescens TaxID=93625 RepID=A0A409XM33_PSICY|nr:hypothetical protein CVT25_013234 [Psilocybe cyanescens]
MPPRKGGHPAIPTAVPAARDGASKRTNIFPIQPGPPVTPTQPGPHSASPGEEFPEPSSTSSDESKSQGPKKIIPIIVSPIKRRHNAPAINRQTDLQVWGMSDDDILGVWFNYYNM